MAFRNVSFAIEVKAKLKKKIALSIVRKGGTVSYNRSRNGNGIDSLLELPDFVHFKSGRRSP